MQQGGGAMQNQKTVLRSFAVGPETFTIPSYLDALSGPMGAGSYGVVCSAVDLRNNQRVAVKKIREAFNNLEDAKRTLREARLLRHLKHKNVISFRELLPPSPDLSFSSLYVVMELMDTDLYQIIRSGQELKPDHVLFFMYQVLSGVQYIHSFDIVHRDLKPANLLVNSDCVLKICDFGMARGIGPTSETGKMTEYVVTRWYRAPEVLLRSCGYSKALDMWSVGCIFAELLNRKALFMGRDHAHQMCLILDMLGTPSDEEWQNVCDARAWAYFKSQTKRPKRDLKDVFTNASELALDLIDKLLAFDPNQRITVIDALRHGYFNGVFDEEEDIAPPNKTIPVLEWETNLKAISQEKDSKSQKRQLKELMYEQIAAYNPDMPPWKDALVTAVAIHEARMAEALQKRARVSYVSTGTSAAEKPVDGGGGGGAEGTSAGNVSLSTALAGNGGREAGGGGSGQAEGGGVNDTVGAKRNRGGNGGTSGDSVV